MARLGLLPSRLKSVRTYPRCPSCQHGGGCKRPWRRNKQNNEIRPAEAPGDCASVDQLKSSVPGLIAQNCPDDDQENPRPKCKLTKRRHRHATAFVDHYSRRSLLTSQLRACSRNYYLVMLFATYEAQSADGKPLRGSVMNMLFMMEFRNSREFAPAAPVSPHVKPEINLKPKLTTHNSSLANS